MTTPVLTPQTSTKLTLLALASVIVFIVTGTWGTSKAFGDKADKSQITPIWDQIHDLKRNEAVSLTMQTNMLRLLENMDKRMERIENNQVWQIQQASKRYWPDATPTTPAPTPTQPNR